MSLVVPSKTAAVMVCPTATGAAGENVRAPVVPSGLVLTLLMPMSFLPSLPEGLE